MLYILLLSYAAVALAGFLDNPVWIQMEVNSRARLNTDYAVVSRAEPESMHTVNFYVQRKNMDKVMEIAEQAMLPDSPYAQNPMTKEMLDELTKNEVGMNELKAFIAELPSVTVDTEDLLSLTATAPISTWEMAFNTIFYQMHSDVENRDIVRCENYYLPEAVGHEIASVANTFQIPARFSARGPSS